MLRSDYDDKDGQQEINADETIVTPVVQHQASQDNFQASIEASMQKGNAGDKTNTSGKR